MPKDYTKYDPYGRNSLRVLVAELRQKIENTGITHTTFLAHESGVPLSAEDAKKIEAALQKRKKIWYDSWIAPLLKEIEEKDPKIRQQRIADEAERKGRMSDSDARLEDRARTALDHQQQMRSLEEEL